ncbi:MAG: hypothetical protein ACRD1T_13305, partial [Acidimicrobiia bacterium]
DNQNITVDAFNGAQVAVSKDGPDIGTEIGDSTGESFQCPEPADLGVVSVIATAPGSGIVGNTLEVVVDTTVHNNGPGAGVGATLSVTLNIPPDCLIGANPFVIPMTLPVSQSSLHQAFFGVSCFPSSHTFTATSRISSTETVDLNQQNNGLTSPQTAPTVVTATADVAVSTVSIAGFGNELVNASFDLVVIAGLTNNGPDQGSTSLSVDLGLPPDCTTTSDNPQVRNSVAVPVSPPPATVAVFYSVICTDVSEHTFTAAVTLSAPPLHYTDTNPANDTGSGQGTITISEPADLKVNSVTLGVPANTTVGSPFDVTADVAVHNNGPAASVNADVSNDLLVPLDCTTSSPAVQTDPAVSLTTSTTAMLPHTWSVTCGQATNHTFTVISTIAAEATVDTNATNNSKSGQGSTVTTVADTDGDGVPDHRDLCPGTAQGAQVDPNGCARVQIDADLDNV